MLTVVRGCFKLEKILKWAEAKLVQSPRSKVQGQESDADGAGRLADALRKVIDAVKFQGQPSTLALKPPTTLASEWLAESYGVIVYQDQVLFIGVNLAGFSWGKVNKFRKALSKKKMDEVEGYKGDFIEGCVKNGVKRDVAEQLFTLVLPFGGYGFNKAHAASYAVVAIIAHLMWNEPFGWPQLGGLVLISSGVLLIHQH